MEDNYYSLIKSKMSFGEYSDKNYSRTFGNCLLEFITENEYDYKDFENFLFNNFDLQFTPESLLKFMYVKEELKNKIENYIELFETRYIGILYLLFEAIPLLHIKTLTNLEKAYRIYEIELEQEFKWKTKLKGEDK